jgi:hypothetical protein
MISAEGLMQFSTLLRERADEDYGLGSTTAAELAGFIADNCAIEDPLAEALLWGEPTELAAEQIDALSNVFSLHRDLLACVLRPTSREVIDHVLGDIAANYLNVWQCAECDMLDQRIGERGELDEEGLSSLIIDALAHTNISNVERLEPAGEPIEPPALGSTTIDQLIEVAAALDPAAVQRVLAYAHQELAGTVGEREAGRLALCARMRAEHLSPLLRAVFDQLAASPGGTLSTEELVERLGLADRRALGQLERSLSGSLRAMRDAGLQPPSGEILVIERRGRRISQIALAGEILESWQALLRAECSPLLSP